MKQSRKRWVGALAVAGLAAYAALVLAGCPNALDDCENTLTCKPLGCDAADADPELCGD